MKQKQLKQMTQSKNTINTWPADDPPTKPSLRFSPTAWAKLLFFRDSGETEISGFGITDPDDLLYVTEFATVKQEATVVSISLEDEAVADFFEAQVDAGRKPEEFFRIWLHTHPGDSAQPSATDEETFERVFGRCDWAVMCIVAQDGRIYARLRFNVGPGGEMLIPVHVDYSRAFGSADRDAWEQECKANIKAVSWRGLSSAAGETLIGADLDDYSLPADLIEQLEEMEPEECQMVLDELAGRPDLWNEECEVMLYD